MRENDLYETSIKYLIPIKLNAHKADFVPEKMKALEELHRVLKPLGRFMIADQVLTIESPEDTGVMVKSWAG